MRTQKIYTIFFTIYLFCFFAVKTSFCFSQMNYSGNLEHHSSNWKGGILTNPFANKVFIEEQGQFKKILGEDEIILPESILYAINNPEFNAYFTATGITFLTAKPDQGHKEGEKEKSSEDRLKTKWEITSLKWLNSNPGVKLLGKEKINDYFTYGRFKDNTQYDHVSAFKKIYFTSIFDGVDAEFELPESGGIKYKFIVHSGYKMPSIAYFMEGVKEMSLKNNGELYIETELNTLIDKAPNAFINKKEIPIKYKLSGNLVELITDLDSSLLQSDLVIDPWLIDPGLPSANKVYDLQEDSIGNVFIYGGPASNYQVRKYNSTGALQWTHITTGFYYGDLAIGNSGSAYISEGIGMMKKLNPSGAVIWTTGGGGERWRLDFNKSKTILASGGFFGSNLSKLDTATGSSSDAINYGLETRAIATDCNGDMYSLHVTFGGSGAAASNLLHKTNADFTPGGSVFSGFNLDEVGNLYKETDCCMGINGIIVHGLFIYIYDGIQLRKFNKNTLTFIDSVMVPNGQFYSCSGIASDYCGNIYVGTMNTIEKYDMSLLHLISIPAPNAVYDILLARNGDILACGNSFVANLGLSCVAPSPLSATATSTDVSCNNGTALVVAAGGGLPYGYLWMPGGQTTALDSGLSPGTYTYIVNDAFCNSVKDSITVIQAAPFMLTLGIVNNESCVNSQNGSATAIASGGAGPYSYLWNTNPAQVTQTAIGLTAGTYNVIVLDAGGCTDTISATIIIAPEPITNFGYTNVCDGATTQFTDSSLISSGAISNWFWNFGDSSPLINTQNPMHIYANPGYYNVVLIIGFDSICADTAILPVFVNYNPIADFTHFDVCFGDTLHFTNNSSVDSSSIITSFLWDFGDGSSDNIQNAKHLYSASGSYSVSLIITTNSGCKDTISKSVLVHPLPNPSFTFTNVCIGNSVPFTDLSNIPASDTIQAWAWSFGDNTSLGTVQSPSHLYTATGSYTIQLGVVSTFGCTDSINKIITVNPNPVIDFSVSDTSACSPLCLSFQNLSTISTGNNLQFLWDFGDGSPLSNSENIVHCYTNSSATSSVYFTPTITVTSDSGCVTSESKNNYITVHPIPDANFTLLPQITTIVDPIISISDLSIGVDFWNWNFGDLQTSSIQNPISHSYSETGTYTLALFASTQYSCVDTAYQTIIIEPDFIFYIPNAFTPNGDGINDFFSGKGTFIGTYEMAIFDRWGNLIFNSEDISLPWDGKAKKGTVVAQEDVYVYSIKITDFKKQNHIYKGIVTLVR